MPDSKREKIQRISCNPVFTVVVDRPEVELFGWVAVHSIGNSGSCGGIRLYPDVTQREVETLAWAMSLKYAFHGIPLGGAKGGIRMEFDLKPQERKDKLKMFGRCIAPLLWNKIYVPWTDMNSSKEDVTEIYAGAGLKYFPPTGNSSYFTALSTYSAVRAYCRFSGLNPSACSTTIEGLGNVGKFLALEMAKEKFKVIAVSTRLGSAINLNGLDIGEIVPLADNLGDRWVLQKGNWETAEVGALFKVPMDIHVPCARTFSIDDSVAGSINAMAVVPAANVPWTDEAFDILHRRGVCVIPDFVTNSGGVTGPWLVRLGGSDERIRKIYLENYTAMFIRMLKSAEERGISPWQAAYEISLKNYNEVNRPATAGISTSKLVKRQIRRRLTSLMRPKSGQLKRETSLIISRLDNLFS